MNRFLKISRIIISLAIFIILGVGLTCPAWMIDGLGDWLMTIQIGPAVAVMSMAVFVCWLLTTLLFGRIYCSTVCPLGALQDIAARVARMGRRGRRRVYRYRPPAPTVRWLFLLIAVVALVAGLARIVSILDPVGAFCRICGDFFNPVVSGIASLFGMTGVADEMAQYAAEVTVTSSIVATLLLAAVVCVAAFSGRTICSTVCPIGTMLGYISRYSVFQFDIDTDKCTQCRRCEYACKAHCINLSDHVVDGSRCVVCFDCVDACRDDAIHYTTDRKRLSQPLMQRSGQRRGAAEAGAAMTAPDTTLNHSKIPPNDETIS